MFIFIIIRFPRQCQNHRDCCSKSCLSFAYKCVPNHQHNEQTTDIRPQQEIDEAQTVSSLAELVDRFGTIELPDKQASNPPVRPNVEIESAPTSCYETERSVNPKQIILILLLLFLCIEQMIAKYNKNFVFSMQCLNSKECCSGYCSPIINQCVVPLSPLLTSSYRPNDSNVNLNNRQSVGDCRGLADKVGAMKFLQMFLSI